MSAPIVPGHDHQAPPSQGLLLPGEPPKPRRGGPLALWVLLGVVALVVLVGGGVLLGTSLVKPGGDQAAAAAGASAPAAKAALESRLARTKTVCDAGDTGTRVGDDGKTLIVDGAGKEDSSGVDNDTLECILVVLDVPESVKEHVYQTRALDGRQEDAWPGFTASWSYHPDSGVEMILKAS